MKLSSVLAASAALFVAVSSVTYAADDACVALLGGKRISLIVPNAAGGGYDIYARALAPPLAEAAGAEVRVVNMPAAGGVAALKRVAGSNGDELLIFLESAADVISESDPPEDASSWLDKLRPLGIVGSEYETWAVRKDVDLSTATSLVAAVSSFDGNIVPVVLAAHLMGIEARLVAGYDGSNAAIAAALRGEADLVSNSLTSAIRASADGEMKIGMIVREGPDPTVPDAPYFAGEGGMVWARTRDLSPELQQQNLALASAIVQSVSTARTLFAPAALPAETVDCLGKATSEALLGSAFADAALAQKRVVLPQDADQTKAVIASMQEAFEVTAAYLADHPELAELAAAAR